MTNSGSYGGKTSEPPEGSFEPAQKALDAELLRPLPMPELKDVVRSADAFASIAAQITVPVSVTFPEHDNIWATDADARALAASLQRHSGRLARSAQARAYRPLINGYAGPFLVHRHVLGDLP